MRNITRSILTVICMMLVTGCASSSQHYTWQDINKEVGPTAPQLAQAAYLKVYTELARVNEDGHTNNIRLPYTIFSTDGRKIKWVRNRYTYLVTLPPGKYVIVPQVQNTKRQIIGATLEPGKLTEIHLAGSIYE